MELEADERRALFFQHVVQEKKLPPVITRDKVTAGGTNDMAQEMVDLMSIHYCMVARVMSGASAKSVGRHAKMFLTKLHQSDVRMHREEGDKKKGRSASQN